MIKRMSFMVLLMAGACASAGSNGEPTAATAREKANVGIDAAGQTVAIDLTHDMVMREQQYAAPRERVWNDVLAAHEAVGLPAVNVDAKAGIVAYAASNLSRTFLGKPMSRLIDCGNGPTGSRADAYKIALRVTELIDNPLNAATTRLRTGIEASARQAGMSTNPLHCTSTGEMEKIIAGMVTARVNAN